YTLQYLADIQAFLTAIKRLGHGRTRWIILEYNFLWAPVIRLAQRAHLRAPFPDSNWLSRFDVRTLLHLSGFEEISSGSRCLFPLRFLGLGPWINRSIGPWLGGLSQKTYTIARCRPDLATGSRPSVSIIVPARNEAGNIAALLDRVPALGGSCEILFVEGHSQDDTWGEIQRQLQSHPRRSLFRLRALQQSGKGKVDAVRQGFAAACGEILIILDSDLAVAPEDLGHFYEALVSGTAEFVNGSRLVYQMERYAMRLLNLIFNKFFGWWISRLIGQPVKDTLCGTKALFRDDYERLRKRIDEWGLEDPFGDFELLFGASRLSLKISDLPVRYHERTYGRTNIQRFRNGWQLLRFCAAAKRIRS